MDNKEVLKLIDAKIDKEEKKLERINNLIKKQNEIDNKGKEAKQKEIAKRIDEVEEKKRLKSVKKENLFQALSGFAAGGVIASPFAWILSPILFYIFGGVSLATLASSIVLFHIQARKTEKINETIEKLEADWKSVETEESEKMLHLEYKYSIKSKKINQLKEIRKTILNYMELEKKVDRKNNKSNNAKKTNTTDKEELNK